jgi:hypothetical protein
MDMRVLIPAMMSVVVAGNVLHGMEQQAANGNTNNANAASVPAIAARGQVNRIEVPAVVRVDLGGNGANRESTVCCLADIVIDNKGDYIVVGFKPLSEKEQQRIRDNAIKFNGEATLENSLLLLRDGLIETLVGVVFLIYAGGKWIIPHAVYYTNKAWKSLKDKFVACSNSYNQQQKNDHPDIVNLD